MRSLERRRRWCRGEASDDRSERLARGRGEILASVTGSMPPAAAEHSHERALRGVPTVSVLDGHARSRGAPRRYRRPETANESVAMTPAREQAPHSDRREHLDVEAFFADANVVVQQRSPDVGCHRPDDSKIGTRDRTRHLLKDERVIGGAIRFPGPGKMVDTTPR